MNPLQQLQEDVFNYAQGNPDTAMVPYVQFRKAVIEMEADGSLIWKVRSPGKIGLACMVMMPSCRRETPNVPGVQLEPEIIVRTFDDPNVNNTGLSGEDVAIANLEWLDDLTIGSLMTLYADWKGSALKPNYDYPGFVAYDSVFTGKLPRNSVDRTVAPSIAQVAGLVTLACANGSAAIYYTVTEELPRLPANGILPTEGEGSSTILYTAPFNVPSGTVVRAIAWAAGSRGSDVSEGEIQF